MNIENLKERVKDNKVLLNFLSVDHEDLDKGTVKSYQKITDLANKYVEYLGI